MPSSPAPSRILFVLTALVFLAMLGWYWHESRPMELPSSPLADPRMQCVSYAPYYRDGYTPFKEDLRLTREEIATDLRALAAVTRCVRTYSVDQGLDQVPDVARELGLTVLLGAWIGRDDEKNRRELERALDVANANADVVTMLIVGNEVLLRREQSPEAMGRWLEAAHARSRVPVTYADVWEFWLRHRHALEPHVDRVTIHILPYWEDRPQPIEAAIDHLVRIRTLARTLLTKPLVIGETGWPSAGRQREGAIPSRVNQARYVREFLALAERRGWQYNFIEAIDQPWKRWLEGTVGGHWGMLDTSLAPKFPLTGAIAERDAFWPVLVWAAAGAALLLLSSAPKSSSRRDLLWRALAGAVLGLIAMWQWEHARLAYRNAVEWAVLGAIGLASILIAARLAVAPRLPARPDAASHVALLLRLVLFGAAVASVWLVVDGRYRDFPTALYLPLALFAWRRAWPACAEERLWAWILFAFGLYRWLEEPGNGQALLWGLTAMTFARAIHAAPRTTAAAEPTAAQ
ncbi:MAG: beta-1,6-glucan synthase [Rhodocyclales bacterium]|nr:beta-1,6-glucan synthase [Rhodocyclales bacterium]